MDRERGIQRYQSIDLLKFLCAFLVVCIHSPFPGVVGEYFVAISRIAVPVFFMITGFFYIDTVKRNQEKNQIIKILKIILFSTLIYFMYELMIGFIKYVASGNIIFFLEVFNCFNYKKIINLLIFNDSLVGHHLWYLNAIVYVLVCSYFLRKRNLFKILYWAIPILLCLDLVFGKYSIAIFGSQFDILYVRNFLCVGIPYFMIGNGIRHLAAKVENQNMTKIKTILLAAVIIFTGLCIVEKYIVISLGINAVRDHYISTTLLASAVFMLFALIPATDNKIISGMSYIGKKYSLYIYIFHPLVITFFVVAAKILSVENLYSLFSPVIVFVVSIIVSALYCKIILINKKK